LKTGFRPTEATALAFVGRLLWHSEQRISLVGVFEASIFRELQEDEALDRKLPTILFSVRHHRWGERKLRNERVEIVASNGRANSTDYALLVAGKRLLSNQKRLRSASSKSLFENDLAKLTSES